MLFATTRSKHDVVTAHKTIHVDCAADGGLFVPFQMPKFEQEELSALVALPHNRIIADVLNLFFSCDLSEWDVEYALGRQNTSMSSLGSRLVVLEGWNHALGNTQQLVQAVSHRLGGQGDAATNWMEIAVRISFLFAAYGDLISKERLNLQDVFDVACTSGDFAAIAAAWYAKQMGLPIGKIICGCNSNGGFWDLLNRGEFDTDDRAIPTATPLADVVLPRNLERIIFGLYGLEENLNYLRRCSRGKTYFLPEEGMEKLEADFFAAVSSDERMKAIIYGVYRTTGYLMSPYASLAYGSLQDYRAITGESRLALLMAEESPLRNGTLVSRVLRIPEAELRQYINK